MPDGLIELLNLLVRIVLWAGVLMVLDACRLRNAVTELNSDLRWAVYVALVLEGRKYFNEIKEEFKANPNTIGRF